MDMRGLIQIVEDASMPAMEWRMVPIDDLPEDTKLDIAHWIAENHPFFASRQDWTEVRDNLLNLVQPPMVWVGMMDVSALHPTMNRSPSEVAVGKYQGMLDRESFEFDPILVSNGRFLDGGHRMEAYRRSGRKLIPVVEVGHLVNAPEETWEQWMDGEDVAFDPGQHP